MKHERKIRKSIKIIGLGLCLIIASITLAKYAGVITNKYLQTTKEFYFTSDSLSVSGMHYSFNNFDGVSNNPYLIHFNISNRLNDIKWTPEDINYNLTISCNSDVVECAIADDTTKTLAYYANTSSTDTITAMITPKVNLDNDETVDVEITASSFSPYKQKLSATFTLKVNVEGIGYRIEDSSNSLYALLVISNKSAGMKDLSINIDDSKFKLNTSTSELTLLEDKNNNDYIDSFDLSIDAYSEKIIQLYKTSIDKSYIYPSTTTDFDKSYIEIIEK